MTRAVNLSCGTTEGEITLSKNRTQTIPVSLSPNCSAAWRAANVSAALKGKALLWSQHGELALPPLHSPPHQHWLGLNLSSLAPRPKPWNANPKGQTPRGSQVPGVDTFLALAVTAQMEAKTAPLSTGRLVLLPREQEPRHRLCMEFSIYLSQGGYAEAVCLSLSGSHLQPVPVDSAGSTVMLGKDPNTRTKHMDGCQCQNGKKQRKGSWLRHFANRVQHCRYLEPARSYQTGSRPCLQRLLSQRQDRSAWLCQVSFWDEPILLSQVGHDGEARRGAEPLEVCTSEESDFKKLADTGKFKLCRMTPSHFQSSLCPNFSTFASPPALRPRHASPAVGPVSRVTESASDETCWKYVWRMGESTQPWMGRQEKGSPKPNAAQVAPVLCGQ
ncbi:uncharacterized protein LOC100439676 [Pongo abelii]|uniref:uncharacterized protein LOC100439676 n=1 Tax=Pongo abelii TaxID=9601 RepID=UPI0023E8CB62|nr:uncharacterized protein LOC100439676 [Pongo abelii]